MPTLHIDLRDGFDQDDVIFQVNNQEVSRRTGVTTNLTVSHAAEVDVLVPEGRCALRLDIPGQNISASIDVDAVDTPLCGDLRAQRHSGVSHAEGSDAHALIFTNLGQTQRGKEIRMTLDDIPKLNRVGEESGSVPRHSANDTISHSVPSSETVEEQLSDNRSPGVVVLAGHAKSFSIVSRSRVCEGSRGQRRVELDP